MSQTRTSFYTQANTPPATVYIIKKTLVNIDTLPQEDITNLTESNRGTKEYNYRLAMTDPTLEQLIISQSQFLGRKIKLLDAGCGKGHAIDDLLSNEELKPYLHSCTGVSLHYFTPIKKLLLKHGERFNYYSGKVQDVLTDQEHAYDIIVDVCGAYLYSKDKLQLLKLYHQALTACGVANVLFFNETQLYYRDQQNAQQNLITKICQDFPETFSCHPSRSEFILKIRKLTNQCPLPEAAIKTFQEKPTIVSNLPFDQLKAGNAISPCEVVYSLNPPAPLVIKRKPDEPKEFRFFKKPTAPVHHKNSSKVHHPHSWR